MTSSRPKQLVLVGSLGITGLLVGAVVGGAVVWRGVQAKFDDAAFLQGRLDQLSAQDGAVKPKTTAALIRVDVAQRKAIHPRRSIVGRLVEVQKTTVASEVTGKITKMPVEEGTAVVGGQTLLAQVDDVWCRLALERGRAEVVSTEAKLKFELLELDRFRELREKNALSQSEFEQKEATVAELRAALAQGKATVEEQSERMLRSTILAPFDGAVVVKHAELGSHVLPGTPIVDIVSRGQLDARLMVPESAINLLHVAQTLPIRIDPLGEEISGTVVSVTPYGPTASRTFPVRVRLDDGAGRLKVGMSVTASIPTGTDREALVVSKDAVLVRPDGSTVWVALGKDDGQTAEVQPVPVTLGARMAEEYAVMPETAKGRQLLVAGTRVVVEGAERLTPGQKVRIVVIDDKPNSVASPGETKPPASAASTHEPADVRLGRREG